MSIPHAVDDRTLWFEVFDGIGNRETEGPLVNIRSASITRVLDGVGRVSFSVPATDKRAMDLLVNDAKVKIYTFERTAKRLLGTGIIRSRRFNATSGDVLLSVSGPDELDDLTRKSVLLALEFDDETINHIVNGDTGLTGLLDLVNGWSATVTASGNHYARFDGMSVLKALQELVEAKGTHFRLADATSTIEVGDFGTDNGLVLVQAEAYSPDMDSNDTIGLIDNITITENGKDVIDFIVALGAGDGETRLDLSLSDRSIVGGADYDIQSDTFNGKTYYYIGTSTKTIAQIIADNSLTLKVLVFDQIQVQSNSAADLLTASNALFDVAEAHLNRHKDVHTEYSLTARKIRSNIKPGDKMRLTYKGWIEDRDGNLLPPQDINDLFWVMEVTENINVDEITTSLKLASVDRVQKDAARIIVGELEKARIRELNIKAFTSKYNFVFEKEMDSTHDVLLPLEFTSRTLRVRSVILRLETTPFRTTAAGAASGGGSAPTSAGGGDHHHEIGAFTGAAIGSGTRTGVAIFNTGGTLSNLIVEKPIGSLTETWRTQSSSGSHTHTITIPAHSHALDYGINDDTEYPEDVTITINGVDRTVALGGDWGASGSAVDVTLDITEYITGEATLQKVHPIIFGCGTGQGIVKVTVTVYEDIQNLG
jgi:hypothetical protein